MEKRLIASIRTAASKLKGGKLRNLKALAPVLGAIREAASLSTDEEAVAMAVIMDRQCSDNSTNLAGLSNLFVHYFRNGSLPLSQSGISGRF